jgi:chromosome condensin MukBEF ATPase and DNA-binding subunit MukB
MAYPRETRDRVRRLYIEGMPLTGAAVCADVPYETARAWKRGAAEEGDDWDTARGAFRVSEQGIDDLNKQLVEDFARQVITTTRELEAAQSIPAVGKAQVLAQLSDAYAKFSRAFSRMNPAYSGLAVALDTLKTLADYLAGHDKAALAALQTHLDAVGAILGKRYARP